MSVTILSFNLQNYYGDVNEQTQDGLGMNHTHKMARAVAAAAKRLRADVICTQEDTHGLALSHFEEVASACAFRPGSTEVVRTYVRTDWYNQSSFEVVQLAETANCSMPTRCALVVALPHGNTSVANVFLAGGRYDDQRFFAEWGCLHSRKHYMDKLLAYRPSIIVGDWNADAYRAREEEVYTAESDYVQTLLKDIPSYQINDYLTHWLRWRQDPFEVLERNGNYELAWRKEPTSLRGNITVDGFAFDSRQCELADLSVVKRLGRYSDHAGVVASFKIREHGLGARADFQQTDPKKTIAHLARPSTKLFGKTPALGVLFKATNCDINNAEALRCLTSGSPGSQSPRSQARFNLSATTHVLLTGPKGVKDVDTPYSSFSGSLTTAWIYARDHNLKFVWRMCPTKRRGVHDLRSAHGIKRLNRILPSNAGHVKTHQGHTVSTAWAKWKNAESGINFDQVLVPRDSVHPDKVIQLELDTLHPDTRRKASDLATEQIALFKRDRLGTWSASPESLFLRTEATLRHLLFAGATPTDQECKRAQPRGKADRSGDSDASGSTQVSEFEDPRGEAPVTESRRKPREARARRGMRTS